MHAKNIHFPLVIISLMLMANILIFPSKSLATGEVLINEIAWMGTEASANAEWIELYNPSSTDVDLTGWTVTAIDGTPEIILSGTISADGYFFLERTTDDSVPEIAANQIYTGALGNTGEQLELKDSSGAIIDSVEHSGGWVAGDNTTKQTMERVGGVWQTSANVGGSPKALNGSGNANTNDNIPPPPPPNNPVEWQPPTEPQNGEVVINELVSDPVDGGQEWVELYNRSDRTIDLSEFTLIDGSGALTTLSGSLGTYEAGRYIVIYSPKGNLNNSGDLLILQFKETIIDQVTYGNWNDSSQTNNAPAAADPSSLSRLPDGVDTNNDAVDFSKTAPTPGSKNILTSTSNTDTSTNNNTQSTLPTGKILFNELYPNPPLGDLENEFIELINLSAETVDVNGWTVSDDITTYKISPLHFTSTFIAPNQVFLLPRPITGIALDNNSNEKITLKSPDNKTVATASYAGPAAEGLSWARDNNNEWLWSTLITPGRINITKALNKSPIIYWELPETINLNSILIFDASDTIDPDGDKLTFSWDFGDGFKTNIITPTHIYSTAGKYTINLTVTDAQGGVSTKSKLIILGNVNENKLTSSTSPKPTAPVSKINNTGYLELDEVKKLSSRTKVVTTGVVAVPSGTFNKDLFLAGSGLQLFLNNGNWPTFMPGDRVRVSGTVSQTKAYGSRLLVAQPQDISLIEKVTAPSPVELAIANLSEDYEGWLIRVTGEITRKDKTSVTLLDGDKTIRASYKHDGPWPELTLNSRASITGFLVLADGEFRLWPRDADDIVVLNENEAGEVAGASDTVITPTNNNWLGYLFIALAALTIIVGWWWEKLGRPKPQEIWHKIFK